jgi:uncharacterized protein YjbI with pentapeptide repeats
MRGNLIGSLGPGRYHYTLLAICPLLAAFVVFSTWRKPLFSRDDSFSPNTAQVRERYAISRGRDLPGLDMSRKTLHVNYFLQSKLPRSSFRGAKLEGVLFFQSQATGADFSEAEFLNVTFQASNLSASSFRSVKFGNATIAATNFQGSDLRSADLSRAKIYLTDFRGAKFNHATRLPFPAEKALDAGMIYVE